MGRGATLDRPRPSRLRRRDVGQDQHDAHVRSQPAWHGLVARVPYGRWETTTFLGAMRSSGFIAPLCVEGAINGRVFLAWVQQQLVPSLQAGDIVVMDNLSSHKSPGVVAAIEAVGASPLPATLFARSQSDRTRLQQVQEAAPRWRRADNGEALESLRQRPQPVHRKRMPELLPTLRVPLQLEEDRTNR